MGWSRRARRTAAKTRLMTMLIDDGALSEWHTEADG
jgi:hypothetical protein